MLCPFTQLDCTEDQCAIYSQGYGCAFLAICDITYAIGNLTKEVIRLTNAKEGRKQ